MAVTLPSDVNDVDSAWVSAALAEGELAGAEVTGVRVEPIGAGVAFLGELARLHLSYENAPDGAPQTIVLKLPTRDPGGRAVASALRAWAREAAFYRELGADLLDRVPRCWWIGGDETTGLFGLLLEDLAPATAGDQNAGASLEQAAGAVDALAELHARFSPGDRRLAWLPSLRGAGGLSSAMQAAAPRFRERFGHLVPEATLGWLERFAPGLPAWLRQLHERWPDTLVHADYRLDNLMFGGERGVAVVDWQVALAGAGVVDLAMFLGTSLTIEDRRVHEQDLLRRYHEIAASDRSIDQLADDYAASMLFWMGIFANNLSTITPDDERGTTLFELMAERQYTAAADHDVGRFLPD